MSQPATSSRSGMAATADAWLYGMAVPRVGSDAAPAWSVEIQLRPTRAMRRVIEPPAASLDPPGVPTVVSPLILPHRSRGTCPRTAVGRSGDGPVSLTRRGVQV